MPEPRRSARPLTKKQREMLSKALKQVRSLIERVRVSMEKDEGLEDDGAGMYFMSTRGSVSLSRSETRMYRECRDMLVAFHGESDDSRELSRAAVERMMKRALLDSLLPRRRRAGEAPTTFRNRLTAQIRRLRRDLLNPSARLS